MLNALKKLAQAFLVLAQVQVLLLHAEDLDPKKLLSMAWLTHDMIQVANLKKAQKPLFLMVGRGPTPIDTMLEIAGFDVAHLPVSLFKGYNESVLQEAVHHVLKDQIAKHDSVIVFDILNSGMTINNIEPFLRYYISDANRKNRTTTNLSVVGIVDRDSWSTYGKPSGLAKDLIAENPNITPEDLPHKVRSEFERIFLEDRVSEPKLNDKGVSHFEISSEAHSYMLARDYEYTKYASVEIKPGTEKFSMPDVNGSYQRKREQLIHTLSNTFDLSANALNTFFLKPPMPSLSLEGFNADELLLKKNIHPPKDERSSMNTRGGCAKLLGRLVLVGGAAAGTGAGIWTFLEYKKNQTQQKPALQSK